MKSKDLKNYNLPDAPGVYMFKSGNDILYIGKATSLKDRVRSYFSGDIRESRGLRIEKMVDEASNLDYEETDSVLEALILESNLIKKFKPKYNAREKDQKSFNYVVVTNEEYPRVFTVRGRELQVAWDPDDIKYTFGPYPHPGELKEALKIVRKIFPFRGKKDPIGKKPRKSKFYQEIGLSPQLGEGGLSKREYSSTIQNLRLFFEGKKKKLEKKLEKEMKDAAKLKDFERAETLKRQLYAISHIRDVSLIKDTDYKTETEQAERIEGYDIAHFGGKSSVGVMVVLNGSIPEKSSYRKFKIKNKKEGSDTDALTEVLERRLGHDEWPLPRLFVIDGGKAQKNASERVLEKFGIEIPVVSVVKDKRHKPREILGNRKIVREKEREILMANAEAHRFAINYHKNLRNKGF